MGDGYFSSLSGSGIHRFRHHDVTNAQEENMTRTPNQSPEPTAVAAAVAIHATSRRWLSFFR
jgi:hypothetical protein